MCVAFLVPNIPSKLAAKTITFGSEHYREENVRTINQNVLFS